MKDDAAIDSTATARYMLFSEKGQDHHYAMCADLLQTKGMEAALAATERVVRDAFVASEITPEDLDELVKQHRRRMKHALIAMNPNEGYWSKLFPTSSGGSDDPLGSTQLILDELELPLARPILNRGPKRVDRLDNGAEADLRRRYLNSRNRIRRRLEAFLRRG